MSTRMLVAAACLVAFLPIGAAAQQVGFGVKGGVSLGDLPALDDAFDEPGVEGSRLVGYAVGGFLAFRFDNGFSIQPEVLYTQKGFKYDFGSDLMTSVHLRIRADYLDVPLLARYTFGKGVRGYVFGGPSLDFRVRATEKYGGGKAPETDISDEVERFEFALVVGGGIEFGPILLEARWSEGLTDIVADEAADAPATAIKTRTVLFLFGFRF